MAGETTVQGVYAEALIQVAQEQGNLDEVKAEIDQVVPALVDDSRVYDFLCTPNIGRDEKLQIIEKVIGKKVSKYVLNFIKTIIRRGRQTALKTIAGEFEELYRKAKNILVVEVTSAMALDDDHREQLKKSISKRYGREVVLEERLDPGLIGGLQIRVEGDFVDASLKSRLRELQTQLGLVKIKSGDIYED